MNLHPTRVQPLPLLAISAFVRAAGARRAQQTGTKVVLTAHAANAESSTAGNAFNMRVIQKASDVVALNSNVMPQPMVKTSSASWF